MILVAGKHRDRKFVKIVALHPCTSPDSREGRNRSAGTIPRPWERKKSCRGASQCSGSGLGRIRINLLDPADLDRY